MDIGKETQIVEIPVPMKREQESPLPPPDVEPQQPEREPRRAPKPEREPEKVPA